MRAREAERVWGARGGGAPYPPTPSPVNSGLFLRAFLLLFLLLRRRCSRGGEEELMSVDHYGAFFPELLLLLLPGTRAHVRPNRAKPRPVIGSILCGGRETPKSRGQISHGDENGPRQVSVCACVRAPARVGRGGGARFLFFFPHLNPTCKNGMAD